MTSVLDLPEEILLEIFFLCDFNSQINLLQSCKRFYAARQTPQISYQLACRFSGLEPVFDKDCPLSFKERESRLRDREEAWWFFQPKWEYAIEADPTLPNRFMNPEDDESDYDYEDQYLSISGDVFSFGSANSPNEMRKTPAIWSTKDRRIQNRELIMNPATKYLVDEGSFIQDVVLCHKQDLMLVVERFHDTFTHVRIRFMKISDTTAFHEEAIQRICEGPELFGTLPVISPTDDERFADWPTGLPADPVVTMSIVGRFLLTHVGDNIKIWIWRTMQLILSVESTTAIISSCLLSDSQVIVLGSNMPIDSQENKPEKTQLCIKSWNWDPDNAIGTVVFDSILLFPMTNSIPDRLRYEAEIWAEPLMEKNKEERIGKYERLNMHDGIVLIKMSYAGVRNITTPRTNPFHDSDYVVREDTCFIIRKSFLSEDLPLFIGEGVPIEYHAWSFENITIFPSTIPSSVYPLYAWRVALHEEFNYDTLSKEDVLWGKPLPTQNFRVYDFCPLSVRRQEKLGPFGNWAETAIQRKDIKKCGKTPEISSSEWLKAIWKSGGPPPNELELRLIKLAREIFGHSGLRVLEPLKHLLPPCINFVIIMIKTRLQNTESMALIIEASRSVPSQFLRTLLRISLADAMKNSYKTAPQAWHDQLEILRSALHNNIERIEDNIGESEDVDENDVDGDWQEISATGVYTGRAKPVPNSENAVENYCFPYRWIENSGHLENFIESSISVNLLAESALMEYGYEFGSELYCFAD